MGRIRIWAPFLVYAVVQGLLLAWVFLGVRSPFADFFKGPLSFMVPPGFFSYPMHLLILPQVFYRILIPFGALLESLLMASATWIFVFYFQNRPLPGLRKALSDVKFGFGQFVVFWLISFLLLYAYQLAFDATLGGLWIGYGKRRMALEAANVAMAVLVNSLIAYATIIILAERTKLGGTLVRALRAFGRHFIATVLFVGFSSLLVYPVNFILQQAGSWISRFNPEVMLFIMGANILVGSLAAFLATGVLTLWYLLQRQPD
jgi:hypothetical protein